MLFLGATKCTWKFKQFQDAKKSEHAIKLALNNNFPSSPHSVLIDVHDISIVMEEQRVARRKIEIYLCGGLPLVYFLFCIGGYVSGMPISRLFTFLSDVIRKIDANRSRAPHLLGTCFDLFLVFFAQVQLHKTLAKNNPVALPHSFASFGRVWHIFLFELNTNG